MAILGPLAVGTRIQFNINFTIPADYDATKGDAVITDTLPEGLSLYLNNGTTITDDKNAVTVNSAPLTRDNGYTIAAVGQTVTITVAAASLTATQPLVATIDTVVTAAAGTAETTLTNTAILAIGTAYVSTADATAEFTLTPLGNTPAIPDAAPINRADDVPVTLPLSFQAAAPTATDNFNYYVDIPYPTYLAQNGTITAFYGDTAGNETTSITVTPTATGISFPSTGLSGKFIKVNIPVKTQNVTGTTAVTLPEITGTYDVSVGGVQGLSGTYTIPFIAAPQTIDVTKTVVTKA